MVDLPDLSRLSLACDTAPPTGPKYDKPKSLITRNENPYTRPARPAILPVNNANDGRNLWGWGLDDSRGDRAMNAELGREQRQNQEEFLERMQQSGDFTPAEMALLRRNMERDMTTPEEDLIRMQQKVQRIEQEMEAKSTKIATLEAEMKKMAKQLPDGPLTPEDNEKVRRLDRQLERRQFELQKLKKDFEEAKAETREQQKDVYR